MPKYSCFIPEVLMTRIVEAESREKAEKKLEEEYGLLVICTEWKGD